MLQSVMADHMMDFIFNVAFKVNDKEAVLAKANEKMPQIVAYLGDKEWFVGSGPSMVDFQFFETIESLKALSEDNRLYEQYPTLEGFRNRVAALPRFAEYLASDRFVRGPTCPYHFTKTRMP